MPHPGASRLIQSGWLTGILGIAIAGLAAGTATAAPSKTLTVQPRDVLYDRGRSIAIAGQAFRIVGRVRRPRAGERVVVRFLQAGLGVRRRRIPVKPSGRQGVGRFELRYSTPHRGRLRVIVTRASGTGQSARVLVARARLRYRAHGPLVRAVQRRLAAMRYSVRTTGVYGRATGFALLAYQGVTRLPRATTVRGRLLGALARGRGRFRARFPGHGRHVEADLSRRVLALLDGRRVVRVLHTSPGRKATPTVLGSFRFYRRHPGRNSSGMLHSTYFLRGYAVHGYNLVPAYSDSHGCLRIPNADALSVYRWIRLGDRIDVYKRSPRGGGT